MRKFGSVAFVYVNQGKLKPRAVKGIFIGYPTGTKGYKIWMMDGDKCVVSRNVRFQEALMYKDVSGVKITEVTEEEVYPTREVEVRDISRKGVSSSEHIVQGGADEVSLESGHHDVQELTSNNAARTGLSNYQLARDRPRRHTVPPVRFSDYDCTEDEVAFTLYIA